MEQKKKSNFMTKVLEYNFFSVIDDKHKRDTKQMGAE